MTNLELPEKSQSKEIAKDDIYKKRNSLLNGKEGFTTCKNLDKNKNKIYMYTAKGDNKSIDQAKKSLVAKIKKTGVEVDTSNINIYRSEADAISDKEWTDIAPKAGEKIYIKIIDKNNNGEIKKIYSGVDKIIDIEKKYNNIKSDDFTMEGLDYNGNNIYKYWELLHYHYRSNAQKDMAIKLGVDPKNISIHKSLDDALSGKRWEGIGPQARPIYIKIIPYKDLQNVANEAQKDIEKNFILRRNKNPNQRKERGDIKINQSINGDYVVHSYNFDTIIARDGNNFKIYFSQSNPNYILPKEKNPIKFETAISEDKSGAGYIEYDTPIYRFSNSYDAINAANRINFNKNESKKQVHPGKTKQARDNIFKSDGNNEELYNYYHNQ